MRFLLVLVLVMAGIGCGLVDSSQEQWHRLTRSDTESPPTPTVGSYVSPTVAPVKPEPVKRDVAEITVVKAVVVEPVPTVVPERPKFGTHISAHDDSLLESAAEPVLDHARPTVQPQTAETSESIVNKAPVPAVEPTVDPTPAIRAKFRWVTDSNWIWDGYGTGKWISELHEVKMPPIKALPAAKGGVPPYTCNLFGRLPKGLSAPTVSASAIEISGAIAHDADKGRYSLSYQCRDQRKKIVFHHFYIIVN